VSYVCVVTLSIHKGALFAEIVWTRKHAPYDMADRKKKAWRHAQWANHGKFTKIINIV